MMREHELCKEYLSERGITDETVKKYGLEFDNRLDAKFVKERLGRKIPKGVIEVIWIPVYDALRNIKIRIARILPNVGKERFICPWGSDGCPYVPAGVYGLAHGKPVIVTEAPIKALACSQAGVAAIGLNGVYGASAKRSDELYIYPRRSTAGARLARSRSSPWLRRRCRH